jgi:GntR family transcriptional regulator, transcriptional repressor for pyruvate dehydrogenase complex
MPFQKVHSEKLSQSVVRQIEQLILRGILRPGERLPPERDLSERLGVSRPSLRDAIADLQERGLVEIRPGAGVYVAEVLGSAFSAALVNLFPAMTRRSSTISRSAATWRGWRPNGRRGLGSDTDLKVVEAIFHKMEAAHQKRDPTDEAALDAQFHMAIIEASHNVVMLHMMRSMYDLLRQGVFYNRQMMFRNRTTRATLLDQHRAINDALQARDPVAARDGGRGASELCGTVVG